MDSSMPPNPPYPPGVPRVMGIDLGKKRIGLALSDPLGLTAQPLLVMPRLGTAADLERLTALAREHQVQEIVIGLPRHMDGHVGPEAEEALDWAEELRLRLGVPVSTLDERLTTTQAERVLLAADLSRRRRRQVIDKLAAVLILQTFLDRRAYSA